MHLKLNFLKRAIQKTADITGDLTGCHKSHKSVKKIATEQFRNSDK